MVQNIIAVIFIAGGIFFLLVSSVGLLRLPDLYSRCHAVGKSETLGSMLLLCGLAIYNGIEVNSAKLVIILLFIALANPTAAHIVARSAFQCGLQPWILRKKMTDQDSPGIVAKRPISLRRSRKREYE
jgi:multicomponent Na+:H+ antiporter subunit G